MGWPPIEALTSRAFDLVHSTTPLLVPARSGLRVCTIYDLDFLSHPERTRAEMRRDFPTLVHAHAARADLVVTISEYSKAQIEARLSVASDRIAVCRPGVPSWIAGPLPRRPAAPGHLLFLGTLEPRKNIAGLLAAYRLLVERRPSAPPLVLAGQPTPAADAVGGRRAGAAAQGPRDHRRLRLPRAPGGTVRGREPAGAAVARRGIRPSGPRGDGAWRPRGGLQPGCAAGSGGRWRHPGRSRQRGDLADALEAVTTDPDLAARLRDAGIARAGRFSWPASARALVDAYARAAHQGSGGRRPAPRGPRA